MTAYMLRFSTIRLAEGQGETSLPAACRVLYLRSGHANVTTEGALMSLAPDSACHSTRAVTIRVIGPAAEIWCWEAVPRDDSCAEDKGALTRRSAYPLTLEPGVRYAIRCDRVAFPPGGIAYTHIHAAAGVRCLHTGEIDINSLGHRWVARPGDTWLERGPEEVFAQAGQDGPASFIRVMLVPESHWGRSTITYVRPEDQDTPKPQQYFRYLEAPVVL